MCVTTLRPSRAAPPRKEEDYLKFPKATYWMQIGKRVDKPFVRIIDDSRNDNGETVKVQISNARLCNDASRTLSITRAEATGTISETSAKLLALARERIGLPEGPLLQPNAPNPFNSGTVISWFQLQPGEARLEVFTVTGQRVAVLHEGAEKAGLHRLHWDGRSDQGHLLASGVYVYRLVTSEAVLTRKLTLLR